MDKSGKKSRDIHFKSIKNQCVMCVHSKEARRYADILEKECIIKSYAVCCVLEKEQYHFINRLGIRKDYFETEWTTDFVLQYTNGMIGIREISTEANLSKRATIEKLEFSRRYWSQSEAVDWKIVIMEKGEVGNVL